MGHISNLDESDHDLMLRLQWNIGWDYRNHSQMIELSSWMNYVFPDACRVYILHIQWLVFIMKKYYGSQNKNQIRQKLQPSIPWMVKGSRDLFWMVNVNRISLSKEMRCCSAVKDSTLDPVDGQAVLHKIRNS